MNTFSYVNFGQYIDIVYINNRQNKPHSPPEGIFETVGVYPI